MTSGLRLLQVAAFTSSVDRLTIAAMLTVIATGVGASVDEVSRAAAAYFLCYGIAQFGWAIVSDRLGRVRTMRLAMLLAAVGGLASAAAPSIDWLIAARGVTGACFAAAIPSALVYIGDTVPVRVRQAPLTDLMTSTALGITAATVCAGALADFTSWRVAFALTGVAAGVLAVLLRKLAEPDLAAPAPVGASLRAVLGDRWGALVLMLALTEGFVLLGPLTFFPSTLQAAGLGVTLSGLLTAAYGIAVLVFARVVKRRSRSTAPARLILIGGLLAIAAYTGLTLDQSVVPTVAACVLLGGGWAFLHSTMQTWATDVAPGARATAVSLFATMLFCGSALGAAVAGPLVDEGRFGLIFALALAAAVPLTIVAATGRRRYTLRAAGS
ncbi:MFS transporter [Prauserella cavernicola]|uniref:MFS transporter n=1 Tax=Prauserella cavernicola TaxID=2800127 RepID=A0A934QM33_9PSEU|nr:MFS transporter [Prauserella cavernicola]MBK1782781.1 MFS transporter [Prauserella cavernicola]